METQASFTMYTTPWCGYCHRLRSQLDREGIAYDVVEAPTFLASHMPELTAAAEQWKKVRFHALREHAGLVFQTA